MWDMTRREILAMVQIRTWPCTWTYREFVNEV